MEWTQKLDSILRYSVVLACKNLGEVFLCLFKLACYLHGLLLELGGCIWIKAIHIAHSNVCIPMCTLTRGILIVQQPKKNSNSVVKHMCCVPKVPNSIPGICIPRFFWIPNLRMTHVVFSQSGKSPIFCDTWHFQYVTTSDNTLLLSLSNLVPSRYVVNSAHQPQYHPAMLAMSHGNCSLKYLQGHHGVVWNPDLQHPSHFRWYKSENP